MEGGLHRPRVRIATTDDEALDRHRFYVGDSPVHLRLTSRRVCDGAALARVLRCRHSDRRVTAIRVLRQGRRVSRR